MEGIQELDQYVKYTLDQLIFQEEERGGMSGLRIFCCIDVSVYQDEEGDWMYYVNEVDRTHNASLFAWADKDLAKDVMHQALCAMKTIYMVSFH